MKNPEKIKVSELAKNAKYPDSNDLHMDDWDTCKTVLDKEKITIVKKDSLIMKLLINGYQIVNFFILHIRNLAIMEMI